MAKPRHTSGLCSLPATDAAFESLKLCWMKDLKKKNNPTKRHCLLLCQGCRPRLTEDAQHGARLGREQGWGRARPQREINPFPSALLPPVLISGRDEIPGVSRKPGTRLVPGQEPTTQRWGETGGLKHSHQQRTPGKQLQDIHRRCCGLR